MRLFSNITKLSENILVSKATKNGAFAIALLTFVSLTAHAEPSYLNTSPALSAAAWRLLNQNKLSEGSQMAMAMSVPPTTLAIAKAINDEIIVQDKTPLAQLKVMTYNVGLLDVPYWGVPYIEQRIPHLIQQLKMSDSDIYFLQEVWDQKYVSKIKDNLKDYFVYSGSGKIRHGLVIMIKKNLFQNKKLKVTERSFSSQLISEYVGYFNGALGIKLQIHGFQSPLYLLTTHLCPFAENQTIRNSQLKELSSLIANVRESHNGVLILGGDFNQSAYQFEKVPVESGSHINLVEQLGMLDTFAAVNGDNVTQDNSSTWATLDPSKNKLASQTSSSKDEPAQRLDYIFTSTLSPDYFIKVNNASIGSIMKVAPTGSDEYIEVSDHYSYQTTLSIFDHSQLVLKNPKSPNFSSLNSEGGLSEIQ